MGTSDERERIEIELFAGNSPDSPFAPPDHASVSGETGPTHGPDRRVVIVAAAVAVLALALGWVLGRSSGEDAADPVLAVDATVARTPVEPIEPADTTAPDRSTSAPAEASPTTVGAEPAAVTADEGVQMVRQVEVAAAMAGLPVEVVTYGNGQRLHRLDLATGTLVTQDVRRQPFGRASLIVGDDWLMFPTPDPDLPTIVVDDDGTVREESVAPVWQMAGTDDGTGLWVMSPELADGGAGTIERVPISGGDAAVLELPGPPSRFDPGGGFVLDGPTGAYHADADGVRQITTGELIAIGRDLALAEECDAALVCQVVVIDRATGERRPIDVSRPLDDRFLTSIAIVGGASVAPDGRLAMVRVVNPSDRSSGQAMLGTVDLTTGAVVEIGPAQDIDETVWSPDSRFLFYNRGGKLVAYEPGTGTAHVVAEELIAIDTFGVRAVTVPG